jgi:hypothetical protein
VARLRGPRPGLTPVPDSTSQPVLNSLDTPIPQDGKTKGQKYTGGRKRLEGTGATDGLEKALGSLGTIGR